GRVRSFPGTCLAGRSGAWRIRRRGPDRRVPVAPGGLSISLPNGFSIAPGAWPWLLVAALAAGLLVFWAYGRIAPSLRPSTRRLLGVLRAVALVAVAFLLARPLLSLAGRSGGRGTVVVLTDVSRSMDLPADSLAGTTSKPRLAVARTAAAAAARSLGRRFHVVRREFAGELGR